MGVPQLLSLYNTMVLPYLNYCLINWGNLAGDANLGLRDEILGLQKSLVRIISSSPYLSHADPLFADLGILKIDDLYQQTIRVFAYKAFHGHMPSVMCSLFNKVSDLYSHRTRGATDGNFFIFGRNLRSVRYLVPSAWNSLDKNLKSSESISSFKNASKDRLLDVYARFQCLDTNCFSCCH